MNRLMTIFVMFLGILNSSIAFGSDAVEKAATPEAVQATTQVVSLAEKIPAPPEVMPWWFGMATDLMGQFPDVNGWLIAVMMFLSVVLRASAELMGFIANKTASKADDQAHGVLTKAAAWTASLLGWFGGGKPAQVEKFKGKNA